MGQANSSEYRPGAEEQGGRRAGPAPVTPFRASSPSLSDQMLLASLQTRRKQIPGGATRPPFVPPPGFGHYSANRDCNSLPASAAGSPWGSRTNSSSSISSVSANSPSPSRQQSFTFVPPSRQDSSFVAWSPQQAAEQRLQRTTSAPRLPHQDEILQYSLPEEPLAHTRRTTYAPEALAAAAAQAAAAATATATTAAAAAAGVHAGTGILGGHHRYPVGESVVLDGISQSSQQREPCLVGWAEVEETKECRLIKPVADEGALQPMVTKGRQLLRRLFDLEFTHRLVAPHTQPEVRSCLEVLRLSDDLQNSECTVRLSPRTVAENAVLLQPQADEEGICKRSNSSDEVPQLPFDVTPVWHMQLAKGPGVSNVYGRCETRALTFPAAYYEEENEKKKEESGERKSDSNDETNTNRQPRPKKTFHVVQRILLSRGVPEALLEGHLVHELLHAFIWLASDGSESFKIDLAAEEGLCNCILACALQLRVEKLQRKREKLLAALRKRGIQPQTKPAVKEVNGLKETHAFLQAIRNLQVLRSREDKGNSNAKESKASEQKPKKAVSFQSSAPTPQATPASPLKARGAAGLISEGVLDSEAEGELTAGQTRRTGKTGEQSSMAATQAITLGEAILPPGEDEADDDDCSRCSEYDLYVTEYELKVINRRLGEMERDNDPAYGVGYRTARQLAMKTNMKKLVGILNAFGKSLDDFVQAAEVCA
ncbi:hypothetical protein, conserved [Eimeria maxima]|uniref:Uncharacterized protein n=1 Tax=Eimeria maxima TaxID=5804 RepID=U6MGH9_EIMMA|nr:hypothetical protein, conserved [Eimeria maxima]CDJ61549.1 hypothetical protein, conserved [Eimeria maxima]